MPFPKEWDAWRRRYEIELTVERYVGCGLILGGLLIAALFA